MSLHGLQVKDWDIAARTMVQFSTQRLVSLEIILLHVL